MAAIVRRAPEFWWLTPPRFDGTVTVLAVAAAESAQEHEQAVRRWAASVWDEWAEHHGTVREWAGRRG